MPKKKPERKSGMTPEALRELERRHRAGEDIRGLFSLKTGKSIKAVPLMTAMPGPPLPGGDPYD